MSAALATPTVEETYTDADALLVAAQQIAELRAALQSISAHASVMATRAAGTKGLEQGFTMLVAMAEEGLRNT